MHLFGSLQKGLKGNSCLLGPQEHQSGEATDEWSLVSVVRSTLLALSIGALLPSIASASSMAPSATPTNNNPPGVWLLVPDASDSLMNSGTLVGSIPFSDDSIDIFKESDGKFALAFVDSDDDDSGGSVTSTTPVTKPVTTNGSTPTTPTPEPSSLALLGLGTMALGLAFAGRRLRPTAAG